MRFVQFVVPGRGRRVGIVEGDQVIDISDPRGGVTSFTDLLRVGRSLRGIVREAKGLARRRTAARYGLADLDRPPGPRRGHLLAPLDPPEVWGAGITYRRSAEFRDRDTGMEKGIYDYVYDSPRPELFFKGTAPRCAGPNAPVCIRSDSRLTATEPELAYAIGEGGETMGFTICNDVSAWDLERENPLFLPLSKIFAGCCALGPVLVTPDELGDPYSLSVTCRIVRGGREIFRGEVSTSQMKRRVEELTAWLVRDNPVPAGTVVSTGTGIMVPNEHALRGGDLVEITIERVGRLVNPVKQL